MNIARARWPEGELGAWESVIRLLSDGGVLETKNGSLRLADEAYLISNEVFQEFLL